MISINSFSAYNTALKYYDSETLNEKFKLMGRAMIIFQKIYWAMKYLYVWSTALQNLFEKFVKLSSPPPTNLM